MDEKKYNPKFSIIIPHYDGVISDEQFLEGMSSIKNSTYRNFEVRIYHDGKLNRPLPNIDSFGFEYSFRETSKRYNNWGHSLRDLGIKEAKGDYILHFNPDNLLAPDGLQGVVDVLSYINKNNILKYPDLINNPNECFSNCCEVVICPIILEGVFRLPNGKLIRTKDPRHQLILDGFPPVLYNIDCMQVVATKKAWLSIGGWHDKSEMSDGLLIQQLHEKYKCLYSQKIIGIHR